MGLDLDRRWAGWIGRRQVSLFERDGWLSRCENQGMNRRHGRGGAVWVLGAMRGSGEDRVAGCAIDYSRGQDAGMGVGHSAVMRSVAATASGQTRIVFGGEDGRKGSQPEEQNEEDG